MSVTGAPDEPLRAGPPIADLVAGLYAALGITAALVARGGAGPAAGRGQRVEASLVNGLISMLAYFSANHFATGAVPERTGNDHPVVWPYGLFHAADGEVAVAPSTPVHVAALSRRARARRICSTSPSSPTNDARMRNREALRALIDQKIGADTVEALDRAAEPGGRALRPRA